MHLAGDACAESAALAARSGVPGRDLARQAWTGPFIRLPAAPTHPTQNPDAARRYVELHSACGAKHVEYASGEESPVFRDLYTRLDSLTRPR